MRSKVIALTGFAASNTSIAAAAAPTQNVAMTLTTSPFVLGGDLNNTSLVTSAGGNGVPQQVTLTSASNVSSVNYTIVGRDRYDNLISEVLAGPNVNTVTSIGVYAVVISITPSATNAGTVSAGVPQRTPSQWILLNNYADYDQIQIARAALNDKVGVPVIAAEYTYVQANTQGMNYATGTQYPGDVLPVDDSAATPTFAGAFQGGQFVRFVITSGAGTSGTIRVVRPHF